MLTWAIARAGLDVRNASEIFPELAEWLQAAKKPTVRQLEQFSKKIHLPFGYLLLDTPPTEPLPFPFFRTMGGKQERVSVNVLDTIRYMQQRQDWVVAQIEESGEAENLPFVGKYSLAASPEIIAKDIRKTIGLRSERWAEEFEKPEQAISYLTERIEEAGIFIVFNGSVLNNNNRRILVEECRGFVIVNKLAPFMFVNNADDKGAQVFTIIHELVHIWLGASAGFNNEKFRPADDPIEQLCDKAATEFLVPAEAFLQDWEEKKEQPIYNIARKYKTSILVIARRALELGKWNEAQFFAFYNAHYAEDFEKPKPKGGDFYATAKKRLGLRFAGLIDSSVREGRLLYKDAYELTGLKGDTYQIFMKEHLK